MCNIGIHYCPDNTSPRRPMYDLNAIDVIIHPHKWDTDNESEKARSQPNHTGIILLVFYFTFFVFVQIGICPNVTNMSTIDLESWKSMWQFRL